MESFVSVLDWIYSFVLVMIILIIGKTFAKKNEHDALVKKYFLKALVLKIVGALSFAIYHIYIYGGGDTFGYYVTGNDIGRLITSPIKWLTFVITPFDLLVGQFDSLNMTWDDSVMWRSASNYFVVRVVGFLAPFAMFGYISITLIISSLSFVLIWKCFKSFCKVFPESVGAIALGFLFFPTVIFWGSGLGKDSLMLGSICGFTYAAFNIFIFNKSILRNLVLLIIFGFALYVCKSYILFAYFGPLAFATFFHKVSAIKNSILKFFMRLASFGFLALIGYYGFMFVLESFTSEQALAEMVATQGSKMREAGSSYDLGIKPENVQSLADLGAYFPRALVAAWFRPWIWEAKNPAMLLSALESLFLLYFMVMVIVKGYFIKTILFIRKSPIIFANLAYATIFCGFVALSTGNFGTLVRYKLPAMPYLVASILIIHKKQNSKVKP